MAHAIARSTSAVISAAEPGSGTSISCLHDFGASVEARGVWVHTRLIGSGVISNPTLANARLQVHLLPTTSGVSAMATDGGALGPFECHVSKQGPHVWAHQVPGIMPRYVVVQVKNLTGVDVASNCLSVTLEYVKESTA